MEREFWYVTEVWEGMYTVHTASEMIVSHHQNKEDASQKVAAHNIALATLQEVSSHA